MNWLNAILNIDPGGGGSTVAVICWHGVAYLLPWFAPIGWC